MRFLTSRGTWMRALALGPVARLSGCVLVPLAKVHEPIWKYDARTLADDLPARLVYGAAAATAFAALTKDVP